MHGVALARFVNEDLHLGDEATFFMQFFEAAAGIHDTHCSTHPGADNGWVVVNGENPESCPNR
jgi:hypothetical protein